MFKRQREFSDALSNGSAELEPTSTVDGLGANGYSPANQSSTMPGPDVEPDTWAPWNLIPLGTLALELGTSVDDLARQLGADQIVLDDIGLRCCTRTSAHALIGAKNARDQAQRDREARMRANLREQGERSTREQRERLRLLENQANHPTYDPWRRG
ncbi:hypothetical protein VIMS_04164 [Mycobacterium marinum]|nr:hypothetical protein VIMS_04164 [Mycobacterium marinum]